MPGQKKAGSKRKLIGEQEIPGGQVRGSRPGKNRGAERAATGDLGPEPNPLPLVEVARSAEADSGRCATQSVQKRKAVPSCAGWSKNESNLWRCSSGGGQPNIHLPDASPARPAESSALLVLRKVPQIKFCRFTAPPFFRKIPRRPGIQRIHLYLRPAGSHSRIRRKRGTNATSFLMQIRVAYEELGAGLANFRAKQHQPQVLGCDTLASHFKTMGSHGKTRALTVQTVFQTLLHFS